MLKRDALKYDLKAALQTVELPSTKEQILRAATTLFAQKGMNGTTTRDIAGLAGVNIAALHYHWGDKEELLQAVYQNVIDKTLELTEQLLRQPVFGVQRSVTKYLGKIFDFFIEHPEYPRILLFGNLEEPPFLEEMRRRFMTPLIQRVSGWLTVLIGADKVRTIDPEIFLFNTYGMLLTPFADLGCQQEVLGEKVPDAAVARRFKEQFIDSVLTILGLD